MSTATDLMTRLGLTIASGGPNGRFPRSNEGPRMGYRYWGQTLSGGFRLGVQLHPKSELSARVASAFTEAGFELMPKKTEAYIYLSGPFESAVARGSDVLERCKEVLSKAA